jgi:Asp-tRNA(Asn)/Glu-tRNA(Gln) amidotransferase A subunit family amidase
MPIGIQLCGACGADALVFRVAAILSSDIVADIQNIS